MPGLCAVRSRCLRSYARFVSSQGDRSTRDVGCGYGSVNGGLSVGEAAVNGRPSNLGRALPDRRTMQAVSRVRGRWGFTGRSRASSLYALVLWVRLTVYGTRERRRWIPAFAGMVRRDGRSVRLLDGLRLRARSTPRWQGVVRPEGFEPPTLGSEDRCSCPLSYGRTLRGPDATLSIIARFAGVRQRPGRAQACAILSAGKATADAIRHTVRCAARPGHARSKSVRQRRSHG